MPSSKPLASWCERFAGGDGNSAKGADAVVYVWVNGELVEETQARVSVFDHGLTTGDGVFETIKIVDGHPFALTRHLARLRQSANGLGLPELDLDELRDATQAVVRANPQVGPGRLRITVTGGTAPLGSDRGGSDPNVMLAVQPMGQPAPSSDVVIVPWCRNERGPLVGLKTTSYADNVLALSYARERGAAEAIFANTMGNLCEGTGTNVFLVRDGRLVTPPLSAGCLAGVTRGLVVEWVGEEQPAGLARVDETDMAVQELVRAEEAFLVSTGRDVQPIRAVDGHVLSVIPGLVTKAVRELFARRATQCWDP